MPTNTKSTKVRRTLASLAVLMTTSLAYAQAPQPDAQAPAQNKTLADTGAAPDESTTKQLPSKTEETAAKEKTPATPAPAPTPAVVPAPVPVAANEKPSAENDVLILSPFTVSTAKDKGYFAENTLAGSRMKTKLSDLGASISVVTKQQMQDFASVDVNDIFRYEVNTEGSSTYTPQTSTQRGDGILDVNAGGTQGGTVGSLTNAGANRVRGLAVPSSSINYYPAIGAIPADSYNLQSFEISRGPNSMLYGMGSPAGIVNQSTYQAKVNENLNTVEVRTDDQGSFRSTFSFNRSLIKDKLAIYGAILYDDKEFQRKPSYDITQRQYAAITYKPFSKTTLTANFENYKNKNRRPNTISPIDDVTQWNLAGRPTYDALTKRVTLLSTGQVVGPYLSSNSSINNAVANAQMVRDYVKSLPGYDPALRAAAVTKPVTPVTDLNFITYNGYNLFGLTALNPVFDLTHQNPYADPLYVPGMNEANQARSIQQIGNGKLQNWFQPLYAQSYRVSYRNPSGGTEHTLPIDNFTTTPVTGTSAITTAALWANGTWSDVYNRDYYQSTGWTNNPWVTNVGNYRYPGVTDRAIYDWKKINVNEANFGSQKNQNYNVELQQEFTKDFFMSAGWFRQDFKQKTNYTIAQLNATVLRIDENKYLTNGNPNPYFGLPFVADADPDQFQNNEVDDHFRAMLAYTPDFTSKAGWMKWLGHHQFLALWSRDETMNLARRLRLNYVAADPGAATFRYLPNPNNGAVTTTSGPNGETGWAYGTQTSFSRNFYLANPGDPMGHVTRSSGEWNAQSYTGNIQVYNYANSSFEDQGVTTTFNTFDAPVRSQTIVNSISTGMTNYFWNDRLVTTFGGRLDKYKVRSTTTGQYTNPDGTLNPTLTAYQKFTSDGFFNDSVIWNRFNPWTYVVGRTKTGGGVLRPFTGWSAIENRASGGNQFWQFVRDFGISYNWSNNFNGPSRAEVDAFGQTLPKPYGVGRDIGFQFSALDNKLFARVTWFQATNINQRNTSDIALTRLDVNLDTTIFRGGWARTLAILNLGMDPAVTVPAAQEQAVQDASAVIWQQPYNYYTNLPGAVVPTQDSKVKGIEMQVNYNTGNWRNRFTFGKQETVNSNGMQQFDAWYAVRGPIMKNAKASDYLLPTVLTNLQAAATAAGFPGKVGYKTTAGTFVDLTTFWTGTGFGGVSPTEVNGAVSPSAYYDINVGPQVSLSKSLNGQAAPNQRVYRWAYNTGYDFTTRVLKGFGVGGAERWESKSVIGYYGKVSYDGGAIGPTTNVNLLDTADTNRPIYDKANYYTDLFVRYKRNLWNNRLAWTLQLNVENAFENGHLQLVAVNFDASPAGYRIIDSRKFTLTSTFEF